MPFDGTIDFLGDFEAKSAFRFVVRPDVRRFPRLLSSRDFLRHNVTLDGTIDFLGIFRTGISHFEFVCWPDFRRFPVYPLRVTFRVTM